MEYDSTLLVRLLPPAPAAFLAGTFAAFLPTAGVLAILNELVDDLLICVKTKEFEFREGVV